MNEQEQLIAQFQQIEDRFNAAVLTNRVDAIRACVTEDWALIDPQGGIIPQERFFAVLEQGLLTHTTMSKEILRVRLYGQLALVTGRGRNSGSWQGQFFETEEWITDVYLRVEEQWRCVLTHLSPVKNP